MLTELYMYFGTQPTYPQAVGGHAQQHLLHASLTQAMPVKVQPTPTPDENFVELADQAPPWLVKAHGEYFTYVGGFTVNEKKALSKD